MTPVGFEPVIQETHWPQTHPLDRAATTEGIWKNEVKKIRISDYKKPRNPR